MNQGLIISGDRAAIESLRAWLGEGCLLKDVVSVPEGARELISQPVDFVILDARFGGIDRSSDLSCLLEIRPGLPVMVIVPSLRTPLAEEFKQTGAFSVLEPPLSADSILDLTRKAVEKNRLQRELEFQARTRVPQPPPAAAVPADESRHFHREVIRRFFKALAQVCDHRRLLDLAVEAIVETFNAGKAVILLFDQADGCYRPRAGIGYPPDIDSFLRFQPSDVLPAWLVQRSRVIFVPGVTREIDFELHRQITALDAEIVLGLFSQGNLQGILGIGKRITGKSYGDDDVELLSLLANYLSMAIENSLLYRDIAQNRAHNEKVLNFLPTGVITVNAQGVVTTVNRSAVTILGLNHDEIIGKRAEKIGSRIADLFHRVIGEKVKLERLELPSPADKKILGVSVAPVLSEDGRVYGALMVLADLTRVKVLEEKEKERERLDFSSQLAARLAHEVKNPLVAIKTFAQLLPRQFEDREFRDKFSQIVIQEVDRLDNIIAQIAKLARLPQLEKEPVDINEVIDAVVKKSLSRLQGKKIHLVRESGSNKLPVQVDPRLLEEAFLQIVANAIEAMTEKGTIRISTRREPGEGDRGGVVEIVFQDDGPGVPQEEVENVFIPFFTSKNNALGLGLTIARQIVNFHQGEIELKSSKGKGTVVRVVIPAGGGETPTS